MTTALIFTAKALIRISKPAIGFNVSLSSQHLLRVPCINSLHALVVITSLRTETVNINGISLPYIELLSSTSSLG